MLTAERERVRARRRIVAGIGAAILLGLSLAACIFDKGSGYQGGGRRDTAPDQEETAEPTTTTTATTPPQDSGAGGDT